MLAAPPAPPVRSHAARLSIQCSFTPSVLGTLEGALAGALEVALRSSLPVASLPSATASLIVESGERREIRGGFETGRMEASLCRNERRSCSRVIPGEGPIMLVAEEFVGSGRAKSHQGWNPGGVVVEAQGFEPWTKGL